MSEFKLSAEIIALSASDVWDEARGEWSLAEVFQVDDPETCLCGHFPITEICVLNNKLNNKFAVVGNTCVKKFMGLPSDMIFEGVKRIRKDISKSLNWEAIQHAFGRDWINEWERDFYFSVMRKRNLTVKQAAKKLSINSLVLKRMKKQVQ